MHAMPTRTPPGNTVAVQPSPGPLLDNWNLLRSFLAIHETGTLTGAAQRLGTTQPSMGRHLRELEEGLGETLFVRLPGRLQPNARADALYAATAPMHQAVRDAARLFGDSAEQVSGVVRVAVGEAYGYHVVPQLLAPLLNTHPELEIELSVSNQSDNLLRRDADIAVRFFRPQQDDLIARKLGQADMGLYAHERYLARFGEPQGFELPPGSVITGFDRMTMPLGPALRGGPPRTPLRFRWRTDAVLASQAAIESGACIGMMFHHIAATRPGLRQVLADQVGFSNEVWLCAHDDLRRSSRMQTVWQHLGDGLSALLAASAQPQNR
jgi:DNA-binding transcriptional LysR family regulator